MDFLRRHARPLAAILAMHVALVVGWAVVVPPFEHPDEAAHFGYVQFVAKHGRQPLQSRETEPYVEQETQQPLSYYALTALPYALVTGLGLPRTDLARLETNPHYYALDKAKAVDLFDRRADRAYYRHLESSWPWQPDYPWDLLLVRLIGLLFTIPLLAVALACGTLVWPGRSPVDVRPQALVLTLMIAMLPQLLFTATGVTNDVLAILVGGVATLFICLLIRERITGDRRVALVGGALIGVMVWTKASLFPLIPLAALAPLATIRSKGADRTLRQIAGIVVVGGILAAPLFLLNQVRYGDLLGRQEVINPAAYAWNLAPKTLSDPYFAPGGTFWTQLWLSSVGLFGMMDVAMPRWYYGFWGLVARVCVVGGLWRSATLIWRRDGELTPRPFLLAAAAGMLLSVAGVIAYNLSVSQPQGRYLLPAVICWVVGGVAAVEALIGLLPERFRATSWRMAPLLVGLALTTSNLVAWFAALTPTYAR